MLEDAVPPAGRRTQATAIAVLAASLCALIAGLAGVGAAATYGAHTSADEPWYLLTARSLATDRDLDVADELRQREFAPYHPVDLDEQTTDLGGGRRVSPHDPLLPVLLAPAMAQDPHVGWRLAKGTLVVLATILAGLTTWTAIRRFSVRPIVAAIVIGGLHTTLPLSAYASQVYPEVPAALAVMVAVALLTAPSFRTTHVAGIAVAVVALPWLAVKTVLVAGVLWALAARRAARAELLRPLLTVTALLVVSGAAYLAVHQAWYGGWTVYASGDHFASTGELSVVGTNPNHLGRARRLVGLLVDRSHGIGAWGPLWLALPAAIGWTARRRPSHLSALRPSHLSALRPSHLSALLAPAAAAWLVATFVALTMHGWWSPGRQVVIVAPLLAIVLARTTDDLTGAGIGRTARTCTWGVVGVLTVAGAVNWGLMAWHATTGGPVLIVDFAGLDSPVRRAMAWALPDGITGGPAADLVLAAWTVLLALTAALAWRAAGTSADDAEADPPAPSPADDDRPLAQVTA